VPGLVDGDGVVRLATGLGWRDVDLRADLARALRDPGYEVAVDSSANLAAVAEYRNGPYAGAGTLAHLTGDVSIGAGLMLDGRLVRGARGFAGDLGHLQLDPAGPPCPCGRRGCLESLAGIRAIITRVLPDAEEDGPISDFAPEIDRVLALARAGDKKTVDALADVGRHLGHGVSFLTNLINPEVVLLGGAFIPLAPWLLPTAEAELVARTVAPEAGGCRLAASALGAGATAIGAAVCTLAAIEDGQLPSAA
jgi:predicted NBD/HSP70 family sugar kinase